MINNAILLQGPYHTHFYNVTPCAQGLPDLFPFDIRLNMVNNLDYIYISVNATKNIGPVGVRNIISEFITKIDFNSNKCVFRIHLT